MTDLRAYMSSEFFEDNQIIGELDSALAEVSVTFCRTYDKSSRSWPYELRTGNSTGAGAKSQSTTAMILCAALAMHDAWPTIASARASAGMLYWPDFPLPGKLCGELHQASPTQQSQILLATEKLFGAWNKNAKKDYITQSDTFGTDDPMLLGWVIDLLQYACQTQGSNPARLKLLSRVVDRCSLRADELGRAAGQPKDRETYGNRILCRSLMSPSSDRQVGDSTYILLRFATVLRSLKRLNLGGRTKSRILKFDRAQDILLERFETRLHEQLSFAEIIDSRFDSTEIAFCLEGMLLIRPDAVSRALFDRVMSVLNEVQESEGYWRSETPMLYRKNGDVLFTVSVESANSILASFALYDKRWSIHDSIASTHIHLIKRYWKWLKARKAFVRIGSQDLKGWHSEHVNDPSLIHLWETSQVAEFLVNFRDQLKRHIARKSLALANCSYKRPLQPEPIRSTSRKLVTAKERWAAASAVFEPVTSLGKKFKIYQRIAESFVVPRLASSGKLKYAMLLYGPPGTGKTTVASSLAWAFDFPLITVTVSDFLADGHAAIEARAKDLFDMLRSQPRSIVLFDEIDQFMLDRDSEFFKNQETVFQFLTPGMLTKLNDLRASESVIFIMATNYAERIDAAIKRQGRIDEHCLLFPPDKRRRRGFIKELWPAGEIDIESAARKSLFLGYADISSVGQRLLGDKALRELADLPRPASPEMYLTRFNDKAGLRLADISRTPATELFAMLALDADAEGFRKGSKAWREHIRSRCFAIFDNKQVSKIGHKLTDFFNSGALQG